MHTVEMNAPIVIWIQTPFAKTQIGMADAMADINRISKLIAQEHVGFAKKHRRGNDPSMKVTDIKKSKPQMNVFLQVNAKYE